MDKPDYAIAVFDAHVEKAGLTDRLRDTTILELGPGDSIATAVIAAAYGARAILVDGGPFVRADVAAYLDLGKALGNRRLFPPSLQGCTNTGNILVRCQARYLTDGLTSLKQLEAQSVDLIFSQAVLEHIRKREFLSTMRECRRILKPCGVCSHRIDLRDHLAGALNNLRFSEKVWESEFFVKSGFYTNRIQYSQMVQLFNEANFQVQLTDVRRWPTLPISRHNLAKEFSTLPDDELCISGFEVLLRLR